eukprot:2461792-Pyramimonas_sp.AAC.1
MSHREGRQGCRLAHRFLLTRENPVGEHAHPGEAVPQHRLVPGVERRVEHVVAEAVNVSAQIVKIRQTKCFRECKGVRVPADLLWKAKCTR